jgi:hypothetical protein
LSLGNLSRILAARTASAAVASTDSSTTETQHIQQQPSQPVYDTSSYNTDATNGGYSHPPQHSAAEVPDTSYVTYPHTTFDNTALHYPQHAFDPSASNGNYQNTTTTIKPDPGASSLEAQLSAHNTNPNTHPRPTSAPQQNPNLSASNYLTAFHDSPNPYVPNNNNNMSAIPSHGASNGYHPAAWRHFADHMMMSVVGNDVLHSGSASPTTSGGGGGGGGPTSNGGWGAVNGVGMGMNGVGGAPGGGMNGKVDISSMAALVVGQQDQNGGGHGSLGGLHGQVWPLIHYSGAGLEG